MVNSKKMSKSSIAVIVLSILLVLSMILGLTGAWFTDSQKGTSSAPDQNFGVVKIAVDDSAAGEWTKLGIKNGASSGNVVPGSKYDAAWTLSNEGTEDVYFKVSACEIKLTVGDHVLTQEELTAAKITVEYKLGDNVLAVGEYAETNKLKVEDTKAITVSIVFGNEMPNEIGENASKVVLNTKDAAHPAVFKVAYSLTIDAIQVANYTIA